MSILLKQHTSKSIHLPRQRLLPSAVRLLGSLLLFTLILLSSFGASGGSLKTTQSTQWYVSGQLGYVLAAEGDLVSTTITSLGAFASPRDSLIESRTSDRDSGTTFVPAFEVGYEVWNFASGTLSASIGFNLRSSLKPNFNATFRESKLLLDGARSFSSSVDLQGGARVRSFTTMVNVYLGIKKFGAMSHSTVAPWIGVGVGSSHIKIDRRDVRYNGSLVNLSEGMSDNYQSDGRLEFQSGSDTSFGWQVMTGLSRAVGSNTTLDLGYRYVNLGKFDVVQGVSASAKFFLADQQVVAQAVSEREQINAHEVFLTLRYQF